MDKVGSWTDEHPGDVVIVEEGFYSIDSGEPVWVDKGDRIVRGKDGKVRVEKCAKIDPVD